MSPVSDQICSWLNLSLVPGVGVSGFWKLVTHFQSSEQALDASLEQLLEVRGVGRRLAMTLSCDQQKHMRARPVLDFMEKMGGSVVVYEDTRYPELLRQLPDSPPVLYCYGSLNLLQANCVAIVGSRAATMYGKRTAFLLAEKLGKAGVVVVSGLALGIDTEAHAGALAGEGDTIAVLGCGIDVVYPRQNLGLYQSIGKNGLLLSEYPPGTRPDGFRFPARNRIIAGLSRGVVVVEAARKSGSLITAQIGLDYGREIFAVPGQVDSFKSEGAHWLLQQGAKLVQNVDDILVELRLENEKCCKRLDIHSGENPGDQSVEKMDRETRAVLELVDSYPQSKDILVEKSGLPVSRLSEILLFLELDGLVELLPGDMVVRTVR